MLFGLRARLCGPREFDKGSPEAHEDFEIESLNVENPRINSTLLEDTMSKDKEVQESISPI